MRRALARSRASTKRSMRTSRSRYTAGSSPAVYEAHDEFEGLTVIGQLEARPEQLADARHPGARYGRGRSQPAARDVGHVGREAAVGVGHAGEAGPDRPEVGQGDAIVRALLPGLDVQRRRQAPGGDVAAPLTPPPDAAEGRGAEGKVLGLALEEDVDDRVVDRDVPGAPQRPFQQQRIGLQREKARVDRLCVPRRPGQRHAGAQPMLARFREQIELDTPVRQEQAGHGLSLGPQRPGVYSSRVGADLTVKACGAGRT